MSHLKVSTNLNIELEFDIAPFYKRLLAWLIDVTIFFLYFLMVSKVVDTIGSHTRNDETANMNWLFLIFILPIALYHLVLEYTMKGQTVGKKILQIRVINQTGGNATISQYILRWLLRVADYQMIIVFALIAYAALSGDVTVFFLVGFLTLVCITDFFLMVITQKAQRLGDIAAGTILINLKTKNVLNETVFMEVEDNYTTKYPEVMKLSDRDLNVIKKVYDNLLRKYDANLAYSIATKIENALQINANQEPMDFINTVLKDYNFLSSK